MTALLIFLMILFALFSGYFSAAQTALLSLSSMQIKSYRQSGEPRKMMIALLVSRPRDLLTTLFMLDILVNILVQNFASILFGEKASWTLKVGVPLVLTLLVGEIVPKSLAFAHRTQVASFVAPSVSLIARLTAPLRNFLIRVTSLISHFLFFFLKKEEEISDEELHHVLEKSQEQGVLAKEEREFIDGYLSLQEASVKEVMRPREDVLIFSLDEPISKLTHLFIEESITRIPVCKKDFETLQGIITAREYLLHRDYIHTSSDLLPYLKKPFFVPETTKARLLLKQMAAKEEALAIVVSEYGSLSGLITKEDLIEQVVGEIVDKREEQELYTRYGKDVLIASGKLELHEIEELFHVSLESKTNQVTVGGLLTELHGDIPKLGEQILHQGILFKVLAADAKRVKSVYIRKEKRSS